MKEKEILDILNEIKLNVIDQNTISFDKKSTKGIPTNIKNVGLEVEVYLPNYESGNGYQEEEDDDSYNERLQDWIDRNIHDYLDIARENYIENEFDSWLEKNKKDLFDRYAKIIWPERVQTQLSLGIEPTKAKYGITQPDATPKKIFQYNQEQKEEIWNEIFETYDDEITEEFYEYFEDDISTEAYSEAKEDALRAVTRETYDYETDEDDVLYNVENSISFKPLKKLGWVVVEDESLDLSMGGVEIQPSGDGIPISEIKIHLKTLQDFLVREKAYFEENVGLHMHVSFRSKLNPLQLLTLMRDLDEENIYKLFGNRSRYAEKIKSTVRHIEDAIYDSENNKKSIDINSRIVGALNRGNKSTDNKIYVKTSKFYGVNTETNYETIEFRYGALEFFSNKKEKIAMFILKWLGYVNKSVSEASVATTYKINDKEYIYNNGNFENKSKEEKRKWRKKGEQIAKNMSRIFDKNLIQLKKYARDSNIDGIYDTIKSFDDLKFLSKDIGANAVSIIQFILNEVDTEKARQVIDKFISNYNKKDSDKLSTIIFSRIYINRIGSATKLKSQNKVTFKFLEAVFDIASFASSSPLADIIAIFDFDKLSKEEKNKLAAFFLLTSKRDRDSYVYNRHFYELGFVSYANSCYLDVEHETQTNDSYMKVYSNLLRYEMSKHKQRIPIEKSELSKFIKYGDIVFIDGDRMTFDGVKFLENFTSTNAVDDFKSSVVINKIDESSSIEIFINKNEFEIRKRIQKRLNALLNKMPELLTKKTEKIIAKDYFKVGEHVKIKNNRKLKDYIRSTLPDSTDIINDTFIISNASTYSAHVDIKSVTNPKRYLADINYFLLEKTVPDYSIKSKDGFSIGDIIYEKLSEDEGDSPDKNYQLHNAVKVIAVFRNKKKHYVVDPLLKNPHAQLQDMNLEYRKVDDDVKQIIENSKKEIAIIAKKNKNNNINNFSKGDLITLLVNNKNDDAVVPYRYSSTYLLNSLFSVVGFLDNSKLRISVQTMHTAYPTNANLIKKFVEPEVGKEYNILLGEDNKKYELSNVINMATVTPLKEQATDAFALFFNNINSYKYRIIEKTVSDIVVVENHNGDRYKILKYLLFN